MSLKHREKLIDLIVEEQPQIGTFVRDRPNKHDIMSGSWDLLSYSFQKGFETLWDHARTEHLLLHPLLMLWRHSVELALKAAIIEIAGDINVNSGHNIEVLYARLLNLLSDLGHCVDDELSLSVNKMISLVQSLDRFADRFRYPAAKNGAPFTGMSVDLDELFQAHWIIVTYCEGATIEVAETRKIE